MAGNKWSQREDDFLVQHLATMDRKEIASRLSRTLHAVSKRVQALRRAGRLEQYNIKPTMPPTLCWTCQHAAGPTMCVWAMWLVPVPGWDAEQKEVEPGIESYLVRACPLYAKDKPRERQEKEENYEKNKHEPFSAGRRGHIPH